MGKKKSMFDGDSYHARYAIKVYKQLMTRKTVTYESVIKGHSCKYPWLIFVV